MADLEITPALVQKGSGSPSVALGVAGATIAAGQAVYLDPASNSYKLAAAGSTAPLAAAAGIALHGSLAGQPLQVLTAGNLTAGAELETGKIYVLSGTPGGIAPVDDLEPNDFVSLLGIASSATNLVVRIQISGVQVPEPPEPPEPPEE